MPPLLHSKEQVDETYKQTSEYLHTNPHIVKEMEDVYWAISYIWDIVPQTMQTFASNHTFPAMEAHNEFDVSVELTLEGFYRQAIVSLRSVLELGLLSVFYNRDKDGFLNIKSWAKGEENTPFMRHITTQLKSMSYYSDYNERFSLFDDLSSIYGELNDYAHTKGIKHTTRGIAMRSNVNHFDMKALMVWLNIARRVAKLIAIVHALRYPLLIKSLPLEEKFGIDIPAGFFLPDDQISYIKKLFTNEEILYIEELINKDDFSQSVINDVMTRPNMTETDLEEQSIKLSKSWIPSYSGGYEAWFEYHKKMYESLSDDANRQFLREAKILKEWAIENNYLKESDSDRFLKTHQTELKS